MKPKRDPVIQTNGGNRTVIDRLGIQNNQV
jgi:hypothetical protein